MDKIGIIGSGTMGSGITHVSAISKFNTYLLDVNEDCLKKGKHIIIANMQRQVDKKKITREQMDNAIKRINFTTDYNDLIDSDIIIEAATENKKIKEKIFQNLGEICNCNTILATNTSSISITELAQNTDRPEYVIGMHFMNPVPIMTLVEVVNGKLTKKETTNSIIELSVKMGKKPIECNDSPGFVTNRILMPMLNEAIYCLMENVATKEAIDEIMKLGMAHPMGPLALADLIGLDVCYNILEVLYKDFNDKKYLPCPLLKEMVKNGFLGRKTSKGFYNY